ncbi:hypothetical protein [Yoonia sp. SS1-5]|uniref:Uncharacterized protein n=1 Tax=Yoonia rhodophyticola TaxID=3137370 RepID=A0AAN0NLF0_9RHOB
MRIQGAGAAYLAYLVTVFVPSATLAQTPHPTSILGHVIDMLCIDLTPDLGCERVMLIASQRDIGTVDLYIFPHVLNDQKSALMVVPGAVWTGGLFGDLPILEALENGSLRITAMQTGSGREPWEHAITIAARDKTLLVAGETFSTYDRIDNSTFSCDVNLLNGRYVVTGTPPQIDPATGAERDDDRVFEQSGRLAPGAYPLENLSYADSLPEICDTIRADWPLD